MSEAAVSCSQQGARNGTDQTELTPINNEVSAGKVDE